MVSLLHTFQDFLPHPSPALVSPDIGDLCARETKLTMRLLSLDDSFNRWANCGPHAEYAYYFKRELDTSFNMTYGKASTCKWSYIGSASESDDGARNHRDKALLLLRELRHCEIRWRTCAS
jgi:hypothetical protein